VPAAREISTSDGHLWIGDEQLLFAANRAYEQLTGDPDGFWDAVQIAEAGSARPVGSPKSDGERWDLLDETEWRRRLPELGALFLPHRLSADQAHVPADPGVASAGGAVRA
jgi:hypothetical protein